MTLPPLLTIMKGGRARPRLAENSEIRPRNANAEAQIQSSIVEWIRTVAPDLVCFHIPNGGYRTKGEAAKLKWVGVLPGVADLALIDRGGICRFMEVKTEKGVLSEDQIHFRDRCVALGVPHAVVKSIDDARAAFVTWKIVTREAPP